MGGFIIGDENGCNRCGRVEHGDDTPIEWVCQGCWKRVCRFCCLTNSGGEILEITLCSEECKLVYLVEARLELSSFFMEDDY